MAPAQQSAERASTLSKYDQTSLRSSIFEEETLRRRLAADEQLRETDPAQWQRRESERLARNRDLDVTNQRLRDLGLSAISLEPSLAQRRRKLRVLQARNAAEIARLRGNPTENGRKPDGTPLASVRHPQQEER